nr:Chain E, ORC1 Peptide [Homo sapiens]6P3W_F Chain F, ORC1 Peptide [Homo sapiens]
ARKRLEL